MKATENKGIWILIPVFGLLVYASLQLWRDYKNPNIHLEEASEKEIVGYMAAIDQNVKRKLGGSLLWNAVKEGDAVFRNDSLRTGLSSSAKVSLVDSSELSMDENSLIVLESSPQGLILDFKTGELSTSSQNETLKIRLKENLVSSKKASLRVRTKSDNETQIEVAGGKAFLREASTGKELELGKENFAKIDIKGQIEAQAVQILLNSPEDKTEVIHPKESIRYPFTWVSLQKSSKQEVFQLSDSESFENSYTRYAHQAIEAPIQRGVNYWRVGWYTYDPKTKVRSIKYTPARRLLLSEDKRLQLLFPENASTLVQSPGNTKIDFSWKSDLEAELYLYELSNSNQFKSILRTQQIRATQLSLQGLEPGTYYWRVSAYNKKNARIGLSSYNRFLIETILPKSPSLNYPPNGFTWSFEEALRFEWGKHLNAKSYQWVVSSQPDFKEIQGSQNTEENSFVWKWQNPGEYYWRVRAYNEAKQLIAESLSYRFIIEKNKQSGEIRLLSPEDQSTEVVENTTPLSPVNFRWQPQEALAANYRLRISSSPSFAEAQVTENLTQTHLDLSLEKEGKYFWRVEWQNPEDPTQVKQSLPFSFELVKNKNLPAVELSYPEPRAELELYRDEEIQFQWAQLEQAKSYRIVIEKKLEGSQYNKKIVDRSLEETKYTKANFAPGDYIWYLYALDESGIQGIRSETREFRILRDRGIAPPLINPPVVK